MISKLIKINTDIQYVYTHTHIYIFKWRSGFKSEVKAKRGQRSHSRSEPWFLSLKKLVWLVQLHCSSSFSSSSSYSFSPSCAVATGGDASRRPLAHWLTERQWRHLGNRKCSHTMSPGCFYYISLPTVLSPSSPALRPSESPHTLVWRTVFPLLTDGWALKPFNSFQQLSTTMITYVFLFCLVNNKR